MVSLRTRVTSINSSKRAEKIIKITKSEKAHLNSSEKYTYMKICASIGRSAVSLSLKIISLIIHSGQRNTISTHSFALFTYISQVRIKLENVHTYPVFPNLILLFNSMDVKRARQKRSKEVQRGQKTVRLGKRGKNLKKDKDKIQSQKTEEKRQKTKKTGRKFGVLC